MAEAIRGTINICMDRDYYTRLDKGAANHSRGKKHFVFQDLVRNQVVTKEWIQARREFLRKEKRN